MKETGLPATAERLTVINHLGEVAAAMDFGSKDLARTVLGFFFEPGNKHLFSRIDITSYAPGENADRAADSPTA